MVSIPHVPSQVKYGTTGSVVLWALCSACAQTDCIPPCWDSRHTEPTGNTRLSFLYCFKLHSVFFWPEMLAQEHGYTKSLEPYAAPPHLLCLDFLRTEMGVVLLTPSSYRLVNSGRERQPRTSLCCPWHISLNKRLCLGR